MFLETQIILKILVKATNQELMQVIIVKKTI